MAFDENALNAQDVAGLLKIGKNMVYALAKSGELGSYTVGRKLRFTMADVDAYIEGQHQSAASAAAIGRASGDAPAPSVASVTGAAPAAARPSSAFRIAGSDIAADIVANYVSQAGLGVQRVYESDYQALAGLYFGEADAACVSLFDRKTGKFNVPYVQRLVPGVSVVVLHVVARNAGLLVRKGNSKGIRRWRDLLREDVSVANLKRGTSGRILLDEQLLAMGAGMMRPAGYEREFASPAAAAAFVAQGAADLMVGDERLFHQVEGLDFLPIVAADVDLVIAKTPRTEQVVRFLRRTMKSSAFVAEVGAIPGASTARTGESSYEV